MNTPNTQLLEGLDVLQAVVDARSFGGAADLLGMSQPGVSRAVARLEKRLGIRLFDRTTRSVRLTDEGLRYYDQVMPLMAALAEATADACEGVRRIQGRLRVNVDPLFARTVLGPRLGPFMDQYPELELELRVREDLGDLVAEGFDLALRFGHPQPSSLVARKLFDTRVLAMAAPAYLARFGQPQAPIDLESGDHRCILYREPVTGRPFAWIFQQGEHQCAIEPQGKLTVNDPGTVYSACLAGLGVAQLFELGLEDWIAQGQLVQLFPDWSDLHFPLYAYYSSRHHVPAKTRALLAFVEGLVQP
ncbi:LysR family transcriptional regulator [Pseudomonas machongensis]|uniref:LysR family transcriptional regulator n=1 Tax=Pseudomonas putida TaxID=303 RepID=UPI000F7B3D34|nr:LysR family transcriptional regulator [Pseudomonas putida]RSC25797.1 LysR family transcriptional regulator [Pseudomonas putida]